MRKISLKQVTPHLIAIVVFVIVAVLFCKPALEGKVLQQSDNIQWKAMYEDQRKAKEETGKLPLWTNGMFSGMPGYQIAMEGDNPFSIGYAFQLLTLSLPKPFYFFLLASICFYLLTQILGINPYLGILGGLSYAFATYHPILIGAGHETKMIALGYLPAFVGGLILIYEKKYWWGLSLTAHFTGLMISANHPQISYYGLIIALFMTIGYVINWIREKQFKHLISAIGLAIVGGVIGVLCNIIVLATTYEYSKTSIRGGSVLADEKSNNNKTGLNKDYALSYSFQIQEPLVMLFPRLFGGSSGNMEVSEDKSKAIAALQEMPQELGQQLQGYLQFYWGGITQGTAGPTYSGAIICMLALLALSFLPNKHKGWMLAVTGLAFMMSWGHYFESFNVFLLEHLPFYNKFRAPSMIMVIPTFVFAVSAMLAAQQLIFEKKSPAMFTQYKKGLYVVGGVFLLALFMYVTGDFKSENDRNLLTQVNQIADAQQKNAILPAVNNFLDGLQEDRKSMLLGDLMRALLFIMVAIGVIWFTMKEKLSAAWAAAIITIFSMIDLLAVDTRYLNASNYQEPEEYDQVFSPSPINLEIAKDTSVYRVFDVTNGVSTAFNGNALTSVYHHSIGGYHAAKLSIYQDLIEKQLYKFPDCRPVVNMLNTKYILYRDPSSGQVSYQLNPEAAGPCWFVEEVITEKNPAKVMGMLDSLSVKTTAIIETAAQGKTSANTGDSIWQVSNQNDEIRYKSSSITERFAVFSEVYYEKGWKAYVDGKETPIYKTNYVLRGAFIPAGKHEITFEFRPDSYYKSEWIGNAANAAVWILLLLAAFISYRKRSQQV
jgi:Bacterial membrane protein YfhO